MSSDSKAKYIILVPDGMADLPIPELGDQTPLEAADTPWMDRMASSGRIGLTRTVPEGMYPGSDVAGLSILGYRPSEVYTGRAPLEAASLGIELKPDETAFRLNLVTLDANFTIMNDHSADHITTAEAEQLISAIRPYVEEEGMKLFPGVSYRNILIWPGGPSDCHTHAPHDFPGQEINSRLPSGKNSDALLRLIIKSWKVFDNHPVNLARVRRGQKAANSIWPWGQGKAPKMRTITERFGVRGSVVAAVDLVKGIGKYAGLTAIDVPGATGYLDTNYQGKVKAALDSLTEGDFVLLHVEAPDEAAHSGKVDLKKKAIGDFDEKIVGPVLKGLAAFKSWRVLLMPDHRTPVSTRVHTDDPVPFIILDSEQWDPEGEAKIPFSEKNAATHGTMIQHASELIEILLEADGKKI
ncbi:MAG: cofactor-independent phosphoglycerate mutase [Pseudomonadota bacterium]